MNLARAISEQKVEGSKRMFAERKYLRIWNAA